MNTLKKTSITLTPGELTLGTLRDVYFNGVALEVSDATWQQIHQAQELVQEKVNSGDIVYGVNTGFGRLAHKHIEKDLLTELQHNLILSHATGVGEYLVPATVR